MNQESSIKMPETLRQEISELPKQFQEQHRGGNRVWRLDEARKNEQLYRSYIAAYYALVTEIDAHVGAITAALKELRIEEETIVIYTSDHGDFVGSHGMVEKCASGHNVYEDTLRVPMILKWNGSQMVDIVSSQLMELIDLYPTLVDMCGLQLPEEIQELQGISLVSSLRGENICERPYIVSENVIQITVVTDRFKLGLWKDEGNGKDMLFDREKDTYERINLIDDEAYKLVKSQMIEYLAQWSDLVPSEDRSQVTGSTFHIGGFRVNDDF